MKKYIWVLALVLLVPGVSNAGQSELDRETARMQGKGLSLTAQEQTDLTNKGWRTRREGEMRPLVGRTFRPADYLDQFDRGSVEYVEGYRNYSLHKVKAVSGITIRNCNFTQIAPGTDVFDRTPGVYGHNLTFIDCNLSNVKAYVDWTVISSNTSQSDKVGTVDINGYVDVTEYVYQSQNYEGLDLNRVRPEGVIR